MNQLAPPDPIKSDTCQESGIDLAFLIDGSDSIDREDFLRIKEWILLTVDAFHPAVRETHPWVYVVQFSERSKLELSQSVSINSEEISPRVRGIEQMRSGTKTYSALEFVNQQVYPTMRRDAIKILITMTDGDASEDRNVAAIDTARRNYDMMVAVGVGPKVNVKELPDFSTRGNVFNVDNFGVLEEIISKIVENICSGEPEEPSPPDDNDGKITPGRNDDDDICSQLPPFGNCNEPGRKSLVGKYYWNKARKACVLFSYKQCPGGNVFDTQYECEMRCGGSLITPTPSPAPVLPIAPGCYRTITDLAFVMDGSASVGEDGFLFLQNFLTTAISEFQTVGEDGVQIGMIQYNDEPKLELDFDQCTSKEVALDTVDNLKYLSGNTRTGLALEYLGQLYDNINQPSRRNTKRVAVVITDGRSQDDVKDYALALRNKGVVIFAIGVGEAEYVELEEIASTPTANYVYNVADYAAISNIKDSLVERICRDIEGIYNAPDADIEEGLFPVRGGGGAEPDLYNGGSGDELYFDKENP